METHSSILAWEIPWMEEPGRLQSMGSQRVGHDWNELACMQPGTDPQPTAGLRQSSVDIQLSLGFGQIRTKSSTPDLCLQTLKPSTPLNVSRCISPVSSGSSTAQSWRCFLFSVPRWWAHPQFHPPPQWLCQLKRGTMLQLQVQFYQGQNEDCSPGDSTSDISLRDCSKEAVNI